MTAGLLPAADGWVALLVTVVDGRGRTRWSEWHANVSDRPQRVELEAHAILGWRVAPDMSVVPIHQHPRGALGDLTETPRGAIRGRGTARWTKRADFCRDTLADLQSRWDAAHPVLEVAAEQTADARGTDRRGDGAEQTEAQS